MTRLELNPYDRDDLIKYLQYAKEKKIENKKIPTKNDRWDDSKYDAMRIDYLVDLIKGKIHSQGIIASSSPEISAEEKKKYGIFLDNKSREKKDDRDDLLDFLYEDEDEPWWKN